VSVAVSVACTYYIACGFWIVPETEREHRHGRVRPIAQVPATAG
jgi:hypothetical protein